MKFFAISSAILGLASAAAVQSKVSYDGWKVYRVTVGDDSAKLESVISKLQLSPWKGKNVAASSVVDVPVPPAQILEFESGIQGYSNLVMHEDLGASIAGEEVFETYACNYPQPTAISAMH